MISGHTNIALSAVSSFSTQHVAQNFKGNFPDMLSFKYSSLLAAKSDRSFHIDFIILSISQLVSVTPALSDPETICKLQLPMSARQGSSFASLAVLNFSNTFQFVFGPSNSEIFKSCISIIRCFVLSCRFCNYNLIRRNGSFFFLEIRIEYEWEYFSKSMCLFDLVWLMILDIRPLSILKFLLQILHLLTFYWELPLSMPWTCHDQARQSWMNSCLWLYFLLNFHFIYL